MAVQIECVLAFKKNAWNRKKKEKSAEQTARILKCAFMRYFFAKTTQLLKYDQIIH